MERIHEHVYVYQQAEHVSCATVAGRQRVSALQYVVLNVGLAMVTVHADFSMSENIQLVLRAHSGATTNKDSDSLLTFDTTVGPMERRLLVSAVRIRHGEARAFVRAAWSVFDMAPVSTETLELERDRMNLALQQELDAIRLLPTHDEWPSMLNVCGYSRSGPSSLRPMACPPHRDLIRMCHEANQFYQSDRARFMDTVFPPVPSSLWGSQPEHNAWHKLFSAQVATWRHLDDVLDTSWRLPLERDRQASTRIATSSSSMWHNALPGQESFLCALSGLHTSQTWHRRWFAGNQQQLTRKRRKGSDHVSLPPVITVHLCPNGKQWVPVVIDAYVPSVSIGRGVLAAWRSDGDLTAMLLQKAYAKICGSYAAIAMLPTRAIIRDLTGYPIVGVYPGQCCSSLEMLKTELQTRLPDLGDVEMDQEDKVASTFMVTFNILDQHHCAFQLLAIRKRESDNDVMVSIRDEVGIEKLGQRKACSLSESRSSSLLGDTCCELPWQAFVALEPLVFAVLHSHQFAFRRRRIVDRRVSTGEPVRLAISVTGVADIVVTCHASCSHILKVTLSRVDRTLSMVEMTVPVVFDTVLDEEDMDARSCHLRFTAAPGEYVITIGYDAAPVASEPTANIPPSFKDGTWTRESMEANLDLLFQCLDEDLDGVWSSREVLSFLQTVERMSPVDNGVVDAFLAHAASGRVGVPEGEERGLTRDDLLDVYHETSLTQPPSVADLIWCDLLTILGQSHHTDGNDNDNVYAITAEDIVELVCCVHSDHPDTQVVMLP